MMYLSATGHWQSTTASLNENAPSTSLLDTMPVEPPNLSRHLFTAIGDFTREYREHQCTFAAWAVASERRRRWSKWGDNDGSPTRRPSSSPASVGPPCRNS